MNILIVGCRRVGTHLTRELDLAGHDISVLDENEANFSLLDSSPDYDFGGMQFTGIPIDIKCLREAGIESMDALICVTPDDNTNLMVCQIASEIFSVPQVVCRVTDPTLARVYNEKYPFQVVCPTDLTAENILTMVLKDIHTPGLFTFAGSKLGFSLAAVAVNDVGKTLKEIPAVANQLLFGLLHESKKVELATTPSPIIEKGDHFIWTTNED